jgi:hypothetical protein
MENFGGVAIRTFSKGHFHGCPPSLWWPYLWDHIYDLLMSYAHPRKALRTMEIRQVPVYWLPCTAACHMGSVLIKYVVWTRSGVTWWCRMCRWEWLCLVAWGITSERSRLGLLPAIAHLRVMGLRGWPSLAGKVYKPLECVKTKYLAMSPVMDNLSN